MLLVEGGGKWWGIKETGMSQMGVCVRGMYPDTSIVSYRKGTKRLIKRNGFYLFSTPFHPINEFRQKGELSVRLNSSIELRVSF